MVEIIGPKGPLRLLQTLRVVGPIVTPEILSKQTRRTYIAWDDSDYFKETHGAHLHQSE